MILRVSKKSATGWIIIISLVIAISGCSNQAVSVLNPQTEIQVQADNNRQETSEKKLQNKRYTLAFVGDIMVHKWQIDSAYQAAKKEYSFSGYFSEVEDYLKAPNLTVGNLETTLAGKRERYTGYPRFNSPESLADELVNSGVDVVTTANNHSFDRKEKGVLQTIKNLNERGLAHTGTFRSAEEAKQILIKNLDGMKVALLSYTYGTNGLVVPRDKKYLVNRIDIDKIKQDLEKARQKAEIVVVCLHFGTEYKRVPGPKEEELVQQIADSGADIIVGTHPHVLQKIEFIQGHFKGEPRKVLVAYSLGNFVSSYRSRYKDTGIILYLNLIKKPEGQVLIDNYRYLPVWVHRYTSDGIKYRVIPVEKGIRNYERKDYSITNNDLLKLKQAWQDTVGLLGNENLIAVELDRFEP